MSNRNPCRAKDPSTCWKHGNLQGVAAHKTIINLLTKSNNGGYHMTLEKLNNLPLKKLNAPALTLAIMDFVKSSPNIDEEKVKQAILLASDVHRMDLRSNRNQYDKTPYIEHPLRNALRIIRFGCDDEATIIGSILHDTVEDHPDEISQKYFGSKDVNEAESRFNSFTYISKTFGQSVADMVEGMSNPIMEKYAPSAVRNQQYAEHLAEAIEDPKVCVGKTSDFIDNAVGLYHNQNSMSPESLRRKSVKYLLVWDSLYNRLVRDKQEHKLPVSNEGLNRMLEQMIAGKQRLESLTTNA